MKNVHSIVKMYTSTLTKKKKKKTVNFFYMFESLCLHVYGLIRFVKLNQY